MVDAFNVSRERAPITTVQEADPGRMPAAPLIRLERIVKVFETEHVETFALRDLDLAISEGEFVSLTGPSGCGKSTLLSILGLLDSPTTGSYHLKDQDVARLGAHQRAVVRNREIGFIFQAFNLIGDLTVEENVALPLTFRSDIDGETRRQRVRDALSRVDLTGRAKHYPSQLSGGQQQRVAVARAIAGKPSVLLADEPTGNLDSVNGKVVMELLHELHAEGSTICMVTHDLDFAQCADRVVHMLDGTITTQAFLRIRGQRS